jgi:hypothetical protein
MSLILKLQNGKAKISRISVTERQIHIAGDHQLRNPDLKNQ